MNSGIKTKPAPTRRCYRRQDEELCSVVHELDECPFYVLDKYRKAFGLTDKEIDILPLNACEKELIKAFRKLTDENKNLILEFSRLMGR